MLNKIITITLVDRPLQEEYIYTEPHKRKKSRQGSTPCANKRKRRNSKRR